MRKLLEILLKWLPLAVIIILLTGLIYAAVQQNMRLTANDPQIQFTEDASAYLKEGGNPEDVVSSTNKIDMSKSIGTFIIVFDESGKIVASSGLLDGATPAPPQGVLDFAKKNGENRVTWAPRKDVRIAAVVRYYSGKKTGYILAARSLREVEKRDKRLMIATAAVLVSTLLITLILTAASTIILERTRKASAQQPDSAS